jgi:type VI secretion system secreted protein Hcp
MALNAYLRLTGATQGEMKGSVILKGREDSIMVIAVDHEVVSPRIAASGLSTGKLQHRPLVITKEVDKSSPLLMNALIHNEIIREWKLEFWQPSLSGTEEQYYSIQLINASIVGIHFEMLNNKVPENMQYKEREHISFNYQKIIWTYEDGGITAQDELVSWQY